MTILIFGDSVTYGAWDQAGGWADRVKRFVHQRVIEQDKYHLIYNLGVSGDNTAYLLERFPRDVAARVEPNEDVAIVFDIGANDRQFSNKTKKFRITPEEFQANISRLAEEAKKITKNVAFMGLVPVDDKKVDPIPWKPDSSYKNSYISKFDVILKSVCKAKKLKYIDQGKVFSGKGYEKLLADGVHPNTAGHEKIAEVVFEEFIKWGWI
ncbi:hypothetical protein HY224_03665 [Candidatus Uhrbacteria bacterium]|nr:hypothetical protein [Candidatus Uhrbacteria bacterium]